MENKDFNDFVKTLDDDRIWKAVKMRVIDTINPEDYPFASGTEIGNLIANAVNGSLAGVLVMLDSYHKWLSE